MECAPGEEAQVDFGTGPWVTEDCRKRRTHVLRITLSHSRKGYSEAIFRQTTENFIRCTARGEPGAGSLRPISGGRWDLPHLV